MSQSDKPGGAPSLDNNRIQSEDFQYVLKTLLDVYRPILEEELKRANDPEALKDEIEKHPPNCEDEIARVRKFFSAFFTEEVARRTVPSAQRERIDVASAWRRCQPYIICCFAFGW